MQYFKRNLFSRVIIFFIAVSFILTSVPFGYANADALRPLAAKKNGIRESMAGDLAKTDGGQVKSYATLDDVNVEGKTALVRPDINVPAANGHITDINRPHQRVVEAAKTIKELAEKGAKVVVIYHQGRPGEPDFMDTPFEHAQQLSTLIGRPVKAINDLFGLEAITAIKTLKPGEIALLKPVRAADPSIQGKILEENPYFTSILRPLIDIFCLDGLSVAHRDSNSVTGFKGVPTIAGRLMVKEIEGGTNLLTPPKPRAVAIGGGKLTDKFPAFVDELENDKADKVFVGGRLANLSLVAAQPEAVLAKTENEQYELAVKIIGKPTADELKAEGGLSLLPQLVTLLAKHKEKIVVPVDMVYLDAAGARHDVDLINGRVPEGFTFLLSGIGPKTAQRYVEIIQKAEPPFKSGHFMGPLSNSNYDVLLKETQQVLQALKDQEGLFFSAGGGDTNSVLDKLGIKPTYISLGGTALGEFLAGKALPGVELLKNNQPDKLKPYVPTTPVEAQSLAHSRVLGPLVKAFKDAGGRLVVRTQLFIEGGKVDAIQIKKVPLSTAIKQTLLKSLGDNAEAITYFETLEIDAQNPHIPFSISTLREKNERLINIERVQQVLTEDPNIALILIPGEPGKKGKMGTPGDINSKKLIDRLEDILYKAMRQQGINPEAMKVVGARPLPAIAQVTTSNIKGELKMAVFVPTPGSRIFRLMQLAQDSGINLKHLLEEKMPAPKTEVQIALLGRSRALPEVANKKVRPQEEASPLDGLNLVTSKINTTLQTIFIGGPNLTPNESNEFAVRRELREIQRRVLATQKVVRIVVPADSDTERTISYALQVEIPGLTLASHPMLHNGKRSTAFIIRPSTSVVLVGYGNEAIKLIELFKAVGYGVPRENTSGTMAVSIYSLNREERVAHALEMGYDLYLTDRITKTKSGEVIRDYDDPAKLAVFESALKDFLVRAYTAKARNILLNKLSQSERITSAKADTIYLQAVDLGRKEAEERFTKQYKGLLSKALLAGKFNLIVDATPEGSGAANKKALYEPALQANPNMKLKFLYEGGEKEAIAEASFSTVSALFKDIGNLTHLRHVSCNTTGLSSDVIPVLEAFWVPLVVDNMAYRRGPDPGDLKGVPVGISVQTSYHHWPDFISVTPTDDLPLVEGLGNTDAAQIGTNTRYHFHMLSLRRLDGQRFDKKLVQRILAAQSRVALVDFPGGVFDSTRLTEIAHNLLPQQVFWAPDGANHLLVPVVMVQETDDPSELRLIYAVPQESIVAPGNVNAADALFGHASWDASISIVNDASGLSQLVSAIETRLPVEGIEQGEIASEMAASPVKEIKNIINTAQAMGVDVDKLASFIKADEAVYQTLAGSDFSAYVTSIKNSLQDEKPRALAVSTGFFKLSGVNTALNKVAELNEIVRIAIYGENAEKIKILLGNNEVITARTAEELVAKLANLDIAPADILALGSTTDEVFAKMKIRQIVAREIGPVAVAKALKELLGSTAADAAFSEFYAGAEKSGAISPEVSSATKEALLAKLQEGTWWFLVDLKPTQQVSEQIAAEALVASEFIDQI